MKQFDLTTLFEAMKSNPCMVNGNFDNSIIEDGSDLIVRDWGDEYILLEIVEEIPEQGIVKVLTKCGKTIQIQFFAPTHFNNLNLVI